jgi:NADH:ubiquinone oxidoreductase subunit F (NADH-binding)/NADH:ubiquinone oxidoreductase subunit E
MELLTRLMELQEAHGAVTDEMLRRLSRERRVPLYRLEGLRGFYPVFRSAPGPKTRVQVCRDIACAMKGGDRHGRRVAAALAGHPDVEVEEVSCLGRCETAPAAAVNEVPVSGTPAEVAAFATGATPLPSKEPTRTPRHWPTNPYAGEREHYGVLRRLLDAGDPAAARAGLLDTLKASGLRGMGGAGFPTGMKWELTAKAAGDPKYVVCNADESEPGTFKDRVILEELPHLLIEAMVLGAWVIGAHEGVIYLRHEYAREKKALLRALDAARAAGVLGPSVLGSGYAFDLRVFVSPGGYIMGEETALLEALEDKRGEPRNKPPFPTNHGLWGQPTLINNVETFAAIPVILAKGADWWAAQGRGECKGLKFLSVSGDVAAPGVYCVPMGTTVAELLEICGGVPGGRRLAAFAPGGASSNFLPADKAGVALDFQALQQAGSMLGSGAVLYVAEGRDLVELALNEVRFFRNESCGKCVPCRVGSHKAVELVEQALAGAPAPGLPALLEELGRTLARTSICGLGQVALGPLLSVMANFPAAARARLTPNGRPALRAAPAPAPAARAPAAQKAAPKRAPARKPAPAKKVAARKTTPAQAAPAQRAPARKVEAKKAALKKAPAKKTALKKGATSKAAAKKTVAKKAAARKTVARKTVAKPAGTRKAAPKKSAAGKSALQRAPKRAAVRKAAPKKPAARSLAAKRPGRKHAGQRRSTKR